MGSIRILCVTTQLALLASVSAMAPAAACERVDFEAVVEAAASALRDLNTQNKPTFQSKLGRLKEKRGWSHDQFLKEAAPLVQDQRIAEYDTRSSELLELIQNGGTETPPGAKARAPDCAVLGEIKTSLKLLIEMQQAKWTYMIGKLDQELGR